MPIQQSYLQVKHSRENRNLALLCLMASGGITVGAPELQDDSALSSLCLLCRRKLIYRNALNCYCVISGNHKGERCFKGAVKKTKRGQQKKCSFKAVRCAHVHSSPASSDQKGALVFSG